MDQSIRNGNVYVRSSSRRKSQLILCQEVRPAISYNGAPPTQCLSRSQGQVGHNDRSVSELINAAVIETLREDAVDLKAFDKRSKGTCTGSRVVEG